MKSWVPWALLAAYGLVFYLAAPGSRDEEGFYGGRSREGRAPGTTLLFATVFISWIFAKSVTNAANLGAAFGLPGAVAYGAWWLSIPVAGLVIVALRTRFGARSLPEWVAGRYGKAASAAFLLAVLIRLYNEVWSNTAVVAGYFGPRGSAAFLLAAGGFTALTLLYTLKGGLRSSIFTDAIQAVLFGGFLIAVLVATFPDTAAGARQIADSGSWTLRGGVDLLLVGLLQSLSYPFHDPVLTDRGFLSDPKTTVRAFMLAGVLGFVAIATFGGVGVPAFRAGLPVHDDAPRAVASTIGAGALLFVNVVMLTSAGSTLDSTFSSIAKALDRDGRGLLAAWRTRIGGGDGEGGGEVLTGRLSPGRWAMAGAAVAGNLPLLFGARILQATTVSGTMVIGLAPIFLLGLVFRAPPLSFHLAFWSGLAIGIVQAAGWIPAGLTVGAGRYADLLGANLWGLVLVTVLFLLPVALRGVAGAAARRMHSIPGENAATEAAE